MENGDPYLEPITANLILNADGVTADTCEWRIDDNVLENSSCNGAVAHNVKYSGSHEIKLTPSNGAPLTATIALTDILIVSFGDLPLPPQSIARLPAGNVGLRISICRNEKRYDDHAPSFHRRCAHPIRVVSGYKRHVRFTAENGFGSALVMYPYSPRRHRADSKIL